MFGPIRALSAMLMVGAVACTFDRSGTGAAPLLDDDAAVDAARSDAALDVESADNDGGAQPDVGHADATDGRADAPADTTSVPDVRSDDGGPADVAEAGPPEDVAPPAVDASSNDSDAASDGPAPESTTPGACLTFPGSVAFTPPGSPTPHCYWVQLMSNWVGSATGCITGRGHLATLTSIEETTFVVSIVPNFSASDRVWVGGTDGRFSADGPGSGPFTWITGEPFVFTNWYSDGNTHEPDGVCDSCAGNPCYCEHRIVLLNDGRWKDAYEAVSYRSVCEAE